MIGRDTLIVLDHPTTFALCEGKGLGAHLMSEYDLATRRLRPLVSVITVGGILRWCTYRGYTAPQKADVKTVLNSFQIVGVLPDIVTEFGDLAGALDREGEAIDAQKTWVAATALVVGRGTLPVALLTADSDYQRFAQHRVAVEYVDPAPFRET